MAVITRNHTWMVLHMSCMHWDAKDDQKEVVGNLMNDGHELMWS